MTEIFSVIVDISMLIKIVDVCIQSHNDYIFLVLSIKSPHTTEHHMHSQTQGHTLP